MEREIELAALDLRYESYRMKNPAVEARLLAAIAERGIEEPLQGVDRAPLSILLNGFKRYRCAVKLGMGLAPYASLGAEEAGAILNLLRVSNDHSLSILEQTAFLDQLRKLEQSSVAELAEQLSRSKSWVSMRLGLLAARTYVLHRAGKVVGYYSLSAGSVRREESPARIAKGLAKHPIGVILLARLAIDRTEHGAGLGRTMLVDALSRAMIASDAIGARAVLVHAIDEDDVTFY